MARMCVCKQPVFGVGTGGVLFDIVSQNAASSRFTAFSDIHYVLDYKSDQKRIRYDFKLLPTSVSD